MCTEISRFDSRGTRLLSLFLAVNLKYLIEAGVLQDVAQVATDAGETQLASRGHQPLLGFQEHTEARARDVFEPRAVERHRARDLVEERLRGRALRRVEPPGDHDRPGRTANYSPHLARRSS